jgi:hypothetical protein
VKKTTRVASVESPARLESWKSVTATYWNSAADPVLADLENRYKSNGLAAALPLSPPSVESWIRIAGGEPTSSNKGESIDVQVVSTEKGRESGLEAVGFRIGRQNWHLDEITLSFEDADYQIKEEETLVLAKNEVPSDVMRFLEPVQPSSRVVATSLPAPNVASASAPVLDLDDLEMAVQSDLHSIGADLGESIEISTRPPDRLLVDARGVSPQINDPRPLASTLEQPSLRSSTANFAYYLCRTKPFSLSATKSA